MKKEAYAENLSCLSHWEPKICQDPPSCGQDDRILLTYLQVPDAYLVLSYLIATDEFS